MIVHKSRGEGKHQLENELQFVQLPAELTEKQQKKLDALFGHNLWIRHKENVAEPEDDEYDQEVDVKPEAEEDSGATEEEAPKHTMDDLMKKFGKR